MYELVYVMTKGEGLIKSIVVVALTCTGALVIFSLRRTVCLHKRNNVLL